MDRIVGKVVYLAGPLTNQDPVIQERNIEDAIYEASQLRAIGVIVVSPHEMGYNYPDSLEYDEWIDHGFQVLKKCDAVVFLPGWRESQGCCREQSVAGACGIPTFELTEKGELV